MPRLASSGTRAGGLGTLGTPAGVGAAGATSTGMGAAGPPDVEPHSQYLGILQQRHMEFDLTKRQLVIFVMLVSLAVLGCSAKENRSQTATPTTAATQSPTIEASGADNGKDITVSLGDTLKLTLTANHSTPFWWAADTQIGDATILQQTDHQYAASATTTGGPGSESWTFRASKAGTTTITNHESSVATPGGAPLHTFTAKVTVK